MDEESNIGTSPRGKFIWRLNCLDIVLVGTSLGWKAYKSVDFLGFIQSKYQTPVTEKKGQIWGIW